ncbi:MAG: hypothetical protein DYH12_14680 [Sorangiineae bacterium PRO1]|nr:hypothetical protein [Sorangiineae bacterium PRO1]
MIRLSLLTRVLLPALLFGALACSVLGSDLEHFTEGGGGATGCPSGLDACGGECVDTKSNPAHCGACGKVCPGGQVCDNGGCSDTCSSGKANCDGACADLNKDPLHCGDCAVACNAGEICASGSCNLSCFPGQTACGSSCVDVQTDDQHCGACDNNCPSGQACKAGKCEVSCTSGQTECSGACVDTQTNQNHCGACGNACNAGEVCSAGQCKIACPGGQTECSGLCKSLDSDDQNCGACGKACVGSEVCSAGQCTLGCGTDETNCSGSCVNVQTDSANCGACGTACAANQECVGAKCVIACKTQLNQAISDPWGYSWDGLERPAANSTQAGQICTSLGGRLPTASELYRVAATQSATVGQTIHTNFLWSLSPHGDSNQIRVRLSDASTSTVGKTSNLNYRCVCPPPLPSSFTGKACYGPAAGSCYGLDAENKKLNVDLADRPPLPKGSAIWECGFYRGHLATPGRLVEAIQQGVGPGSNVYLHTADDVRNDSDLILRWLTPATFALGSGVNHGATTNLRPFRCAGSSLGGTHPSSVADEWVAPKSGQKTEATNSVASGWAAAASACFGKGGHVPTTAELAELVGQGLPGGTNAWLWGADTSSIVLNVASLSVLRWTATATPIYNSGNDLSALSKTTSQASRCVYYPIDATYTGPSASACAGGCKEIALPGGSGAKLWFDTFDRAPSANLQTAIDTCRKNGGHLASGRDLLEGIRAGLANGSGAFIWTGDFSLFLQSPLNSTYVLRAGSVRWTGTDLAFADAFGSSSSTADPTAALPYRCVWTNESR